METNIIPFDLETAEKIQAGEIEGKIKTKNNKDVRIICWDRMDTETPIVLLVQYDDWEGLYESNSIGEYTIGYGDDAHLNRLVLEVPDSDTKEYKFKPFDKVLVRDTGQFDVWKAGLFSHCNDNGYSCNGAYWAECIPYEGNEHLVGTTDKPKEE